MTTRGIALACTLAVMLGACRARHVPDEADAATTEGGGSMALAMTTTAFQQGGTIPKSYTCDAEDVSPELGWSGAPAATQSFALRWVSA